MKTDEVSNTDVESPLSSATEKLREHSTAVRDDLRDLGRASLDVAQEKLTDARRAAGDVYDQGRKKAGDFEDQFVDYIREAPMKSLLIAAGAGLLLGMFMSRR